LWHKCEELSRQGRRFHEIVQTLAQSVEDSKIEREIPAPAEKGMLRIMTVHGSKGLQFPRVVLLDFDGEYRGGGSPDLIWDRTRGVHLFERDEEGQRLKEGSSNELWSGIEKQAAVAESKRVFYVALTRPQEQLILAWKKEVKVRKAAEHPDYRPGLTDNWREWVETVALPPAWEPEELEEHTTARSAVDPYQLVRLSNYDPLPYRARHSPSEWLVLSQCSLRYRWKFWDGLDDAENEQKILPDSASASEEASEVADQGKRIHALLEHGDWDGLRHEFGSSEIADATIEGLKGCLGRTDQGIDVHPEIGFEVPLSSREALVGMMDRLEVDPVRKAIRVVDYKFTARPKSAEALLAQYSLQIRLYAWAAVHLVDFVPERLEGAIAHFCRQNGLQWIALPEMDREALEREVQAWFKRAKEETVHPSTGDHCRYCEFRNRCPTQKDQA
jgi:ATP-dependent exoDNAse (exonuclease V) beta subunit